MKLIVEVQLPKELQDLVTLLGQAARIYSEGAMAFPPEEASTSASASTAEPAADSAPKASKSSKRKKDSPSESPTSSESPTGPSPKTESTTPSNLSLAVESTLPLPTLNDVKVKVMSLENGHALATGLLKKMGKGKLSELSGHELVDFLSQLGVA
jgi:hypothetical protein